MMKSRKSDVQFIEECKSHIVLLIGELLEKKHLYQRVKLSTDELIQIASCGEYQWYGEQLQMVLHDINGPWSVSGPLDKGIIHPAPGGASFRPGFALKLPDIKIYCRKCDRSEAFNAQSCKECSSDDIMVARMKGEPTIQVFVFSYLCQSCKSIPEFFMVRREGNKLTLTGRSPIEYVDVPKVIPKEVHKFYTDAIVAHQSGKTLAGLFFLRTLIEQWVIKREATEQHTDTELEKEKDIDKALERYGKTLPKDFRSRFPSLKDLYSQLSTAIHAADPSQKLFNEALSDTVKHFDARRVYELK